MIRGARATVATREKPSEGSSAACRVVGCRERSGDLWAGGTPAEEYRYEASGYRYLHEGRDGRPLLSLRNADGKTLSVYAIEPDEARPVLERDLLYGLGQLLVERIAGEPAPDPSAASTMSAGGDFLVELADPGAFATYSVDIRADSGYSSHLDARIVDAEGRLHVPDRRR